MTMTGRELRSTVSQDGVLTLSIEQVSLSEPAADEVIVRVEAAPINPSDLGLMVGPADIASLRKAGTAERPELQFDVTKAALASVAARIGQSLPVGIEGAGTVVAAGADAQALLGKRVGSFGGGIYADYRKLKAKEVMPLPEGASAADGASLFVNPLTALGFVETARSEGHKAIIHTAAASNLGQMLQKICLKDGAASARPMSSTAAPMISEADWSTRSSRPAPPSPSTRSAAAHWRAISSRRWSRPPTGR